LLIWELCHFSLLFFGFFKSEVANPTSAIYFASMNTEDFKNRTKAFALRVIRLTEALPKNQTANVIGKQLLRCGTSVGANYRAACRARSTPEFIAKMGIVEEECDESMYWMELIIEAGLMEEKLLIDLKSEANEILSMVIASIKTARSRK
jgi:four helix bundle protein